MSVRFFVIAQTLCFFADALLCLQAYPGKSYMRIWNEPNEGIKVIAKYAHLYNPLALCVFRLKSLLSSTFCSRIVGPYKKVQESRKMSLHQFFLFVAQKSKEAFPQANQKQIPLEKYCKILRKLGTKAEEMPEFTQFMKDNRWLEESNNVQSIDMRNMENAVRLAAQIGGDATSPQMLEAADAMSSRIDMLQVYKKVSEAIIEGHQYRLGDFTISVGNFKKRSKVQALVVEIQYRPCVHAEHANEVFDSMLVLLGSPAEAHRDQNAVRAWEGLGLPELYSPRHTAAQYIKLAEQVAKREPTGSR
jgi:hypothetical protein